MIFRNSLLVAGYSLLVAGYSLLVAGYSLLVAGMGSHAGAWEPGKNQHQKSVNQEMKDAGMIMNYTVEYVELENGKKPFEEFVRRRYDQLRAIFSSSDAKPTVC